MSNRKLGRGLQALLGSEAAVAIDATVVDPPEMGSADVPPDQPGVRHLPLDRIVSSPYQARKEFPAEEIAELAASIRSLGVIQPIVVRRTGSGHELVAGERRLRAAQEAGLQTIPVCVVAWDDRQTFEAALAENLQRRDLNPVEKAIAFEQYLSRFQATHESLARQLGVSRVTVTNFVRLLELAEPVRDAVRDGAISHGHAKVILGVGDRQMQARIAREVADESLSVRELEKRLKLYQAGQVEPPPKKVKAKGAKKSNHILSLEGDLRRRIGSKVEIQPKAKDRGSIVIHFDGSEDFERLMKYLTGPEA